MNTKARLFIASILVAGILSLSACSTRNGNVSNNIINGNTATTSTVISQSGNTTSLKEISVNYDSEDSTLDWKNQTHQTIDLSKGSTQITKSGIYEITGTLEEGSLVVNVDKKADEGTVFIILNNVIISSSTSAPIYIQEAKKAVLILADGTQNTIYQGSGCTVDENGDPSAAIYSKADMTITGSGTLNVTSDYNDGISGKDTVRITDGTIVIKAKGDGIVGKDLLAVQKGSITIDAGKDGLRSTNDTEEGKGNIILENGTFNVAAVKDAIEAVGIIQIDNGTYDLTSGGGYPGKSIKSGDKMGFGGPGDNNQTTNQTSTETTGNSMKGLKASGGISIKNGTFTISSYQDAINSDGMIAISGGSFTIKAGDDGIHSNTNLSIDNATVVINNSYESMEGQNITVNSGKIRLNSDDDAFNVNNQSGILTITGGDIYINAGGDGTDSNGSIVMTGGTVIVDGPTNDGNGAIDYDGSFTINGGTIVAAGSSGMAEVPDTSSVQAAILMYYSSVQQAGTTITLKDSNGNVIASSTPAKQYSSVAISTPDLKTGSTYTLYSGNTKVVTFTAKNTVTWLNESGETTNQSMGPGGGGGGFGGRKGGDRGRQPPQ